MAAVEPLEGANIIGYFRSETEAGGAARQIVNGLDNAPLRLLPVNAPLTGEIVRVIDSAPQSQAKRAIGST